MISSKHLKQWNDMRFGLVLSGGGAKGTYEAGVIYALKQLDILDKVSVVSGTSIGALNTLLVAMDNPEAMIHIWDEISYKDVLGTPELNGSDAVKEKLKYIKENHREMSLSDIKQELKEPAHELEFKAFTQDRTRLLIDEYFDINKLKASKRDYYVCAYNRNKNTPVFFELKKLSDEEAIKAALASAAIPHIFPPVEINGELYSDGGINDPEYKKANAVNTPIEPMSRYDLDAVIVIYLSDDPKRLVTADRYSGNVINIIPSESIEAAKFTGTMNFTQTAIKEKRELGYRDAIVTLSSMIFEFLKGERSALGEKINVEL